MKKSITMLLIFSSLGFSWTANHEWETGDTITWNVPYQSQKSFRNWTSACMPTSGAMIVNFFYSGASFKNFSGTNHVWNQTFNINNPYQTTGQRMYAQGIVLYNNVDTTLNNYLKSYPKSGINQYYNNRVSNKFGPIKNEWFGPRAGYTATNINNGSARGLNKNLIAYLNKKHSIETSSVKYENISSIRNNLYNGPVIISVSESNGNFYRGGHIIVIKGVTSNGNLIINDPWGAQMWHSPGNNGNSKEYSVISSKVLSAYGKNYRINYNININVRDNFTRNNHPFSPYNIPVEANVKFKYDGSGTLNNQYDGDGDFANIYNGFSIWNPQNSLKYYYNSNSVLGFLYTKTTTANATNAVRWTPKITKEGKYNVLVGFLKNSANTTNASYTVYHTNGENKVSINQKSNENTVETRGNITYKSLGSYCFDAGANKDIGSVHLDNEQNEADKDINIDIVKFVYVGDCTNNTSIINGTGSVVAPSQTRTIGGDQDIVALQEGSNSMGSFQWYQQKNYCPNLLIKNDDDSNEVDKVLVIRKNWSNSKILSSFETTLPFSLTSNQNNSYDTILIKSLSPLTEKNEIRAICSDNSSYSFRKTITNPNFITENGYIWRGNGSIISDELTGTGIGKTKDIAYKGSNEKSLTIFQWQPSDRCEKLKISGAYYDYDKKRFYRGYGFSGKLSTKTWNSNTYNIDKNPINFPYTLSGVSGAFYMVEIRTEGISSSYPYIYAECTE